jgi:hypothetical protein
LQAELAVERPLLPEAQALKTAVSPEANGPRGRMARHPDQWIMPEVGRRRQANTTGLLTYKSSIEINELMGG